MELLFEQIANYVNMLDWAYILTFILICYGLNYYKVDDWITRGLGIRIRTRYKVLIVGFLYAIVIFFMRGYSLSDIEALLQSFVFAIVFHKLLVQVLVDRFLPKRPTPPKEEELL